MMSGFASTIAQGFAFGTGSAVAHRVCVWWRNVETLWFRDGS